MKKRRNFTEEYRTQIVKEVLETGESGLVARRHNLHPNLVSRWVTSYKEYGKTITSPPPKARIDVDDKTLINENELLRKQLSEKELEIQILNELLKKNI